MPERKCKICQEVIEPSFLTPQDAEECDYCRKLEVKSWVEKMSDGDESLKEIRGKIFLNAHQWKIFEEAGFDMTNCILTRPFL